jgi:putative DNA primase/helicase
MAQSSLNPATIPPHGFNYMPDHTLRMPSIPERPSKRDAEQGLETIKELLIDFKFVGAVDRAVALSLIISSIVRGALHMVPLHAFTAPTPGSGKSYLADITTAIVSGRYCPVITPGRSEEELEKRLGSMLLSGCPTISLDNISSELTGDALCQVTERPTIRIRILGKSETPECEFRGIVIANGNNLVVAGDMTRRVVIGKLDTGLERPEGREFNSDPVRMVLADRGKYIAAALTIVRAYIAADKPDKLIPLASYAAWSDLVRSSLIWLGNADPVISMQEARDNDPVVSTLRAALEAWRPAFGDVAKTTSEVAAKLFGFDPDTPEGRTLLNLREALVPVASVRNVIDATKLSYWLRKSKGRPVGDLKFTGVPGHGGVIAWKVIKAPGASK